MLALRNYFPASFLHEQASMFLAQKDADGSEALFAAERDAVVDADVNREAVLGHVPVHESHPWLNSPGDKFSLQEVKS